MVPNLFFSPSQARIAKLCWLFRFISADLDFWLGQIIFVETDFGKNIERIRIFQIWREKRESYDVIFSSFSQFFSNPPAN